MGSAACCETLCRGCDDCSAHTVHPPSASDDVCHAEPLLDLEVAAVPGEVKRIVGLSVRVNHAYSHGIRAFHLAALHNQVIGVHTLIDGAGDSAAVAGPDDLTACAIAELEELLAASELRPDAVVLNIYDVGCLGVNKAFTAIGTGAFHVAVQVYGSEWSFERRVSELGPCLIHQRKVAPQIRPSQIGIGVEKPVHNSRRSSVFSLIRSNAASGAERHPPPRAGTETDMGTTGLVRNPPRGCQLHAFRESVRMGQTTLSAGAVEELMEAWVPEWLGVEYDVLARNCSHFSDAFCRELGVGPAPVWIMFLATEGAALNYGVNSVATARERQAIMSAAKAMEADMHLHEGSVFGGRGGNAVYAERQISWAP